jgi:hypothetical protein
MLPQTIQLQIRYYQKTNKESRITRAYLIFSDYKNVTSEEINSSPQSDWDGIPYK